MTEQKQEIKITDEEENIRQIIKTVKSQGNAGSGGEMAIYRVIVALIDTGLTTAACGSLDTFWQHDLKTVLNDKDSLNRVARLLWWGEQ